MSVFRARPADGVAWVTGASSGIGYALCLALAREGYTVVASARRADKLEALSAVEVSPGRIVSLPLDVTDTEASRLAVERIEAEFGAIAVAVLNAGTSLPARGDRLQVETFDRVYDVNLFGVVRCLVPLIERMRGRGRGQIAIIGSLTAYFGLPGTAAYGATKAALNNMAEALRYDLEAQNIRIQIVNPGFVATPMTQKNRFPMPALIQSESAARRVAKGLRTGGFEVTFPRRLALAMKALRFLPQSFTYKLIRRLAGRRTVLPEGKDASSSAPEARPLPKDR